MTLELNKIYCWDCLELMKSIPDKSIDLVLTDPPYGIGMDKDVLNKNITASWNNWDDKIPEKIYFDEMIRISKNQIIRWWNYFTDYLFPSSCWLVWDKNNWASTFGDWELAWTSFDKTIRIRKFHYVWLQAAYKEDTHWKVHPTQKPVWLFRRILEKYSEKWQTILDCFLWSWTTAVACKEMWRNFIGIEKEQKYVDIANNRLENTTIWMF